jgi:hypothetical protein
MKWTLAYVGGEELEALVGDEDHACPEKTPTTPLVVERAVSFLPSSPLARTAVAGHLGVRGFERARKPYLWLRDRKTARLTADLVSFRRTSVAARGREGRR